MSEKPPPLYLLPLATSNLPPYQKLSLKRPIGDRHIPSKGAEVIALGSPDRGPRGSDLITHLHRVTDIMPSVEPDRIEWPTTLLVEPVTVPRPQSWALMKMELVWGDGFPDIAMVYGDEMLVPAETAAAIRERLGFSSSPAAD